MELSSERIKFLAQKVYKSRTRLLVYSGFFGVLAMSLKFKFDSETERVYTDGQYIALNPDFIGGALDSELDFAIMHEIMHLALKHPFRGPVDDKLYNEACDIVVNSNILDAHHGEVDSITVFGEEQPHLTPSGVEGAEKSVEEVYAELLLLAKPVSGSDGESSSPKGDDNKTGSGDSGDNEDDSDGNSDSDGGEGDSFEGKGTGGYNSSFDDHSHWKKPSTTEERLREADFEQRMVDAAEISKSRGTVPAYIQRLIGLMKEPSIDWRTFLNNFVQEDIIDYSFVPPDVRMQDSPFILPGFNVPDEVVKKVLFMVDTSGSMSDKDIADCYSEIKGAIDQFNGKLRGYLGFFDADVKGITPFDEDVDILAIRPVGGGGTDFTSVFEYVKDKMSDDFPSSIVILTDGIAPVPDEKMAMGIPVLWVFTQNDTEEFWGKVAYMHGDSTKD